jgi:hypothetical protein
MDPWTTTLIVVATCVTTFGVDASLTGFLLMMSERE